jgi:pimeloyl-ACP methyl ester carboxylesterase
VSEPEWASPNHVTIELDAMRVRDFSVARGKRRSTLIVAPFALHDARIADLSPGHSLVETLRANGCSRLFLIEWKSATAKMKLRTIDSHLCDLNVAADDIGPPVDLIGLCQGGWLSLVYAARFAGKVRRLVLAGAPIDLMAEPSIPSADARMTPKAVIDDMIRAGDGLVLGRTLLDLWPREDDNTQPRDVETAIAPCGHLALFMGRDTLKNEWPRIARWLSERPVREVKSPGTTRRSQSVESLPSRA